jgi:hypothetical protein
MQATKKLQGLKHSTAGVQVYNPLNDSIIRVASNAAKLYCTVLRSCLDSWTNF